MPLWIPITIAAAFLQNLRSGFQKQLKGQMGTTGATFARFGFGLPFVALYLAALVFFLDLPVPTPNGTFVFAVAFGGIAQILGTFLLVHLFSFRNFMVGTAYSKTEPMQAALFGLLILGEEISPFALFAIVLGIAGVAAISVGGRGGLGEGGTRAQITRAILSREAGIGVLSGALFGVSAVCFRWASLSLGDGPAMLRAATSLLCAVAIQTVAMLAYMALFDRAELGRLARGWRPALLVGFVGVAGSTGWFTAMALEKVAYVRALGQIELIFTYASSVLWFRETITRLELVGCALIVSGILTLLATTT